MFSPQRPMSFDHSYEDFEDGDLESRSIHSLEKRKIVPQTMDGDSEPDGSVHIDNTLSPSPRMKGMKFDLNNKAFLKRMNSTNVDSESSPEDEKKKSKLSRMESYKVTSKPHQFSMAKSPDARKKKADISPDLHSGRLASPVNRTSDKTSSPKSLMSKLPKEPKK